MKNIYLAVLLLLIFISCKNVDSKSEVIDSTDYQVSEIVSSNINESHFLEILKSYLEMTSERNIEVKKVFLTKEGDLRIENEDGNFLSVYGLSSAEVYIIGLNTEGSPKAIIEILNEGGGGGGNVQIVENYLIDNDIVTKISRKLLDAPKSEFGYDYLIKGVNDGYVIVEFQRRNDVDYRTLLGDKMELKCELVDNSLKVVEVLKRTKQFSLFCDDTNSWVYSVSLDDSKILFKLFPGEENDFFPNKDEIIETVEGTVKNNVITIPVPEDCEDCGYGYATGRFKFSNGVLYDANIENGYNEYYFCNYPE